MYTVLIVDDEMAVHQSIRLLGKWEDYDVTRILDAYNGCEALELLRENSVDLMLVDIKMPKMGGLELIERSKALPKPPRVIIISGYGDFQYAQFAVRLNVEDYLLKPINRHEFAETMERTMERIVQSRFSKNEQENGISTPLAYEQLLKHLLYSEQESSLVSQHSLLETILPTGKTYRVMTVYVLNFQEINEALFLGDTYSAYAAFCNVMNEKCSEIGKGYSFSDDKQPNAIVVVVSLEQNQSLNMLKHALFKIVGAFDEIFHAKIVIAVSEAQEKVNLLKSSYEKTRGFLQQINLLGNPHGSFFVTDSSFSKQTACVPSMDSGLLTNIFQTQNFSAAKRMVEDYVVQLQENKYYSPEIAERVVFEWLAALEYIGRQLGSAFLTVQYNISIHEIAKAGYELKALQAFLEKTIEMLINQYAQMQEDSSKSIPKAIKEYIDSYYYTKIGLSTFSEQFFLNKDYLSKLFKQEYGYGISEYLLMVRMKQASYLLKESDLTIRAIAEQVGFPDNNYFSKAFKNFYGCNPKDVRE